MQDRESHFRRAATECITVAKTTSDPVLRAELLEMAEGWLDLAMRQVVNRPRPTARRAIYNDSNLTEQ
jgi:hypothetical protein